MGRMRASLRRAPIVDSHSAAALLAPAFAELDHEELYVVHLDAHFAMIHLERVAIGGSRAMQLPVRAVIAEALRRDTHAIVLAHNHPGGDPTPSRADRRSTRRLAELARALDIRLVDHLIFAVPHWTSFRAMGLL